MTCDFLKRKAFEWILKHGNGILQRVCPRSRVMRYTAEGLIFRYAATCSTVQISSGSVLVDNADNRGAADCVAMWISRFATPRGPYVDPKRESVKRRSVCGVFSAPEPSDSAALFRRAVILFRPNLNCSQKHAWLFSACFLACCLGTMHTALQKAT